MIPAADRLELSALVGKFSNDNSFEHIIDLSEDCVGSLKE